MTRRCIVLLIFMLALACIFTCDALRMLQSLRKTRPAVHRLQGKNIRDEEASMKNNKGGKKQRRERESPKAANYSSEQEGTPSPTAVQEIKQPGEQDTSVREVLREPQMQESKMQSDEEDEFEIIDGIRGNDALVNSNFKPFRVPRKDPTAQSQVPPEVVFFGEPRRPPPVQAAQDNKYHGSLLAWARHTNVVPQTSEQRLETVFPKGRLDAQAMKYRLENENLSFKKILDAFSMVKDDLDASKAFIAANIDIIPSKLFLRALTAEKLSVQSKKDLDKMFIMKELRNQYILAHHQLFFPLNIEVQKAETRVMTYLARDELKFFAEKWDDVETSLHFTTLLAARLTWDEKVKDVLDNIREKISGTVGYMAKSIEKQLMSREFRKPGTTAEVYLNASLIIEKTMPAIYKKVRPEIKALHETFFIQTAEEKKRYTIEILCPRENISPDQLKESLRIFDASIAAVQGVNYIPLRLLAQQLLACICEKKEYDAYDKWFTDFAATGYNFNTYEPDEIPTLVKIEQRIRDTRNAFTDFAVQVLKRPTAYTEAFSGARPKGGSVGNWLDLDPDWAIDVPESQSERLEYFREAYIEQCRLREEAEMKLGRMVDKRIDKQDKAIFGMTGTTNSPPMTEGV